MEGIPELHIDPGSSAPVYRQIADAITDAIRGGRIRAGQRLPPTRELARALGVNRNTVVAAYDALAAKGVVSSHIGRGTFVLDAVDEGSSVSPSRSVGSWTASFSRAVDGAAVERLMTVYRATLSTDGISFAGAYPDPGLMPVDAFRDAVVDVLRRRPERALSYGPTVGDPELRELLADDMRRRGSTVTASALTVTSGAQQGLEIVFRTMLDRGDVAVVEDPTYTGALSALASIGARVVGLPSDDQGVDPETLRSALERHRPKLLYVQPTFQNPTTKEMSVDRRHGILELARRYRCAVVEDDWAGDLRFEGTERPTLHALDGGRNVLYLSSFSKKLMPGLRIGWIAAPDEVSRRLEALKQVTDCGTSPLLQAALSRFVEEGHLADHLDHVREVYASRRDAMRRGLERHFPDAVSWRTPRGGLFTWVELPEGSDGDELFVEAERRGVSFSRGSLFHLDGRGRNTLRLAFAALPSEKIDEGLKILGSLVRDRLESVDRSASGRVEETLPVL